MRALVLFTVAIFASSCATVRVVKKKPRKGGELAVTQGFIGPSAEELAAQKMSSNCRGKYEITEEGEAVVGSKRRMKHNSTKQKSYRTDVTSGNEYEESRDMVEWRIKYKCTKRVAH